MRLNCWILPVVHLQTADDLQAIFTSLRPFFVTLIFYGLRGRIPSALYIIPFEINWAFFAVTHYVLPWILLPNVLAGTLICL